MIQARLCLFSRAMLSPVHRLLYHYVSVHKACFGDCFWQTICEVQTVRLYVQFLEVWSLDYREWRNYLHLLPNCTICLSFAWRMLEPVVSLGYSSMAKVEQLHIHSVGKDNVVEPPLCIHKWTSLKVLTFTKCRDPLQDQLMDYPPLSLNTCHFTNCSAVNFLLCRANILHTLHVTECVGVMLLPFMSIVEQSSSSLHDIRIFGNTFDNKAKASMVLDKVAILACNATNIELGGASYLSPKVLDNLSPSIEDVYLYSCPGLTSCMCMDFISKQRLRWMIIFQKSTDGNNWKEVEHAAKERWTRFQWLDLLQRKEARSYDCYL
jgi:hypothetical protein